MNTITITSQDLQRLQPLVAPEKGMPGAAPLRSHLAQASVVAPESVPATVVTMNSLVRIVEADTGEQLELKLVFPRDADIDNGRISIFAPLGTALLGARKNDVVSWQAPLGMRSATIRQIRYQPEAAGNWDE
jgi:regulator of nucleoside diphosphate kinase